MLFTTLRSASTVVLLGALAVVIPVAKAQSAVPTCNIYSCPLTDDATPAPFALGPAPAYQNSANGVLFCSYPAVDATGAPISAPTDFSCTYDMTTTGAGALIDNGDGACFSNAIGTPVACARKRAMEKEIAERNGPAEPRAAGVWKKRTSAGKKGRSARRAAIDLTVE